MKRTLFLAAALVVAVLAVTIALPVFTSSSRGPCWDNARRCNQINQIRENHHRESLKQLGNLQNIADLWARSMALSQILKHNPDLRAQTVGLVGENVGYGPDWKSVRIAFMNSPSHRANILDRDYSEIGIGAQRDNGTVWIVLVFQ